MVITLKRHGTSSQLLESTRSKSGRLAIMALLSGGFVTQGCFSNPLPGTARAYWSMDWDPHQPEVWAEKLMATLLSFQSAPSALDWFSLAQRSSSADLTPQTWYFRCGNNPIALNQEHTSQRGNRASRWRDCMSESSLWSLQEYPLPRLTKQEW